MAARTISLSDPASGLRGFIVLDDLTLGPAAGGIRTWSYADEAAALADAERLARAMTLKCALAGIDAGGGKGVILDHPGLDRPRAFRWLGDFIENLGGIFHTAGDLGTSAADLAVMASRSRYVHGDDGSLTAATARGLLRCIEAVAEVGGRGSVTGLHVAVQGTGAIGGAAAKALHAAGARLSLADVDHQRARQLAAELGAELIAAEEILAIEADVLAPCAIGGVITLERVAGLKVFGICGAANNALASAEVADALVARGILHVPDPIASAGAVIAGIGGSVMGLADSTPLIDRLGVTAQEVLREALSTGQAPSRVAEARALRRIRSKL